MGGWVVLFQYIHSLPCLLQEVMINVGDVGKDYEHGVQLLKKLGEFRGGGDGVRNQGGGSSLTSTSDVKSSLKMSGHRNTSKRSDSMFVCRRRRWTTLISPPSTDWQPDWRGGRALRSC